jgi:hypothetical protein
MARSVAYHLYFNDDDPERHRTACQIKQRARPYLGFPAFVVTFNDGVERVAISEQLNPYYDLKPGEEDPIFGN